MSLVVVTAGLAAAITDAAAEGKTSCSEVCVYMLTPTVTAVYVYTHFTTTRFYNHYNKLC